MDAKWPLWETLVRMARQAAFADPRFDPVPPAELPDLQIEISVLTPPEPMVDPEKEIVIGTHGILIETQEGQRGVLLPQVAASRNWEVITFLEHTCRKARLPLDAWRDSDIRVFRFAAEVFGEGEGDLPGDASCEDGCG
jgi:AmmeMemoRadiSam system protein A